MDGLSVTASIVAVVDVSVKIITLCSQYSKGVANAGADIARLAKLAKGLKTTLEHAKALIEGPQGASLSTSHDLQEQLAGCQFTLQELKEKLEPGVARPSKGRFWVRALKWPFSHGEIEARVSLLESYHRRIMDGLLVDQTTLLLHIKNGVDNFPAPTNEDMSIAKKPHFIIPFPQDPDFIPRPAIQAQIRKQLTGKASRLALIGMGGFGKSQLAIELAHNVHQSSPEKSVFWLRGNSRATFEASYRSLADILALPRRHDPKANILALVCDWLQREDVAQWLIILDNADDFNVFFGPMEESPLASYLPKSSNGRVLVTSRNLNVAEKLIGSQKAIIQLPTMSSDEALLLLQEKLNSSDDRAAATDLVRCLDFIPLAVNQAAAYINRRRISINAYIQRFQDNDRQKTSLLRHDGGDIRRHESVSNSVAITWQVTFDQVRQESSAAANLLSLLSCFQPQNIPQYMLSGYNEAQENSDIGESACATVEDDMDVLFAYSLVSTPAEPQLYEMHSLVQVCTRAWLSELDHLTHWENLFLQLASERFPRAHFETWHECQLMLPHLQRILEKQPDTETEILRWGLLLRNVSYYKMKKGDYTEAEFLAQKSVEVRENILGLDHPDTLSSMTNLAAIYRNQGRWGEAEKLEVQVMETSKAKLGADHPHTLSSMAHLAATYWNQGRLDIAEKLEAQVIETSEAKLKADHPDTLSSIVNLAAIYRDRGRWDEAEKLGVQVMKTSKAKLAADHPHTLISMANLAATYICQGRWEEAEKLEVQVMKTRKAKLGEDHPHTLTSMAHLAAIYQNQSRWDEAEKLGVQVMKTSKAKLGTDHPHTLNSMANLASTFWSQGRWEEAEKLQVQVMDTYKTKLGADHPSTLTSMAKLALTFGNQGRCEEAERLEVQVMETRKTKLGADHPDTLNSMHNLAYTFKRLGHAQEAIELMDCCASLRECVLGSQHPDTKSSKSAIDLWQQDR